MYHKTKFPGSRTVMKSQDIDFREFQYWKSQEIDKKKVMKNWEMVMKNRKKSWNIEWIIRSHNKCTLLGLFHQKMSLGKLN